MFLDLATAGRFFHWVYCTGSQIMDAAIYKHDAPNTEEGGFLSPLPRPMRPFKFLLKLYYISLARLLCHVRICRLNDVIYHYDASFCVNLPILTMWLTDSSMLGYAINRCFCAVSLLHYIYLCAVRASSWNREETVRMRHVVAIAIHIAFLIKSVTGDTPPPPKDQPVPFVKLEVVS